MTPPESSSSETPTVEPPRLPGIEHYAVLLLGALVLLAVPAWSAEFLNFDDPRLALPDSGIPGRGELDRAGFGGALDPTRTVAEAYLPVSHVSLLIDLRFLGGSARVFHLHGLLLHLLAACALVRLAGRLGLRAWAATAVGGVFLIHPALCESSLWISGRKDVLSGLFTFLALGELAGRGRVSLSALWTLLACYAKGSAIVLGPFALVVTWFLRSTSPAQPRSYRPAWAVFAVAVVAALHHTIIATSQGTMTAPVGDRSSGDRLAQVPGALAHYVETTFWPARLNVLYPEVATLEAFQAAWLSSSILLLVLLAAVVLGARSSSRDLRRVAVGLAIGLLALAPFNTAFPATSLAAADRYLYLAIPGFALALVSLPRIGPWLGAACALPLALLCFDRAPAFHDSESLWRASLAQTPQNAVASFNLAADLSNRNAADVATLAGLYGDAEAAARYPQHRYMAAAALTSIYERFGNVPAAADAAVRAAEALVDLPTALAEQDSAIEIRVESHLTAARLAQRMERPEVAEQQLGMARELDPDAPLLLAFDADRLRAQLRADHLEAGGKLPWPQVVEEPRAKQASDLLQRALAERPDLYEAYWVRGELNRLAGRFLRAERDFQAAIALAPQRAEAHTARIDLWLAREGESMAQTAEVAARTALEYDVRDPGIRFRLATALFRLRRIDAARENYEAYLRLRPDDREARVGLAIVLAAVGYQQLHQLPPAELRKLADRILELDPLNLRGLLMKAVVARQERRLMEAMVLLDQLREKLPGDAEIRQIHAETVRDLGWQRKLEGGRDRAAYDLFRRFLDLKVKGIPTEAVENALKTRCRDLERIGRQALVDADYQKARESYERCLELRPQDESVRLHLGMALMQFEGEDRQVALDCFERAERWQRENRRDPSLAVLYQCKVLLVLGQREAAMQRGQAYLDALPDSADPLNVQRIRTWLAR